MTYINPRDFDGGPERSAAAHLRAAARRVLGMLEFELDRAALNTGEKQLAEDARHVAEAVLEMNLEGMALLTLNMVGERIFGHERDIALLRARHPAARAR